MSESRQAEGVSLFPALSEHDGAVPAANALTPSKAPKSPRKAFALVEDHFTLPGVGKIPYPTPSASPEDMNGAARALYDDLLTLEHVFHADTDPKGRKACRWLLEKIAPYAPVPPDWDALATKEGEEALESVRVAFLTKAPLEGAPVSDKDEVAKSETPLAPVPTRTATCGECAAWNLVVEQGKKQSEAAELLTQLLKNKNIKNKEAEALRKELGLEVKQPRISKLIDGYSSATGTSKPPRGKKEISFVAPADIERGKRTDGRRPPKQSAEQREGLEGA